MMKIAEGQIITDTMQEVSVNDQSEHGEAKNTSKNSVKVLLIHSLPLFGTMSWKHNGKFCKVAGGTLSV